MGLALADEAAARGARVTVVAANVSLPRAPAIEYVDVTTAAELAEACKTAFADADVLVMAAAVADYRPAGAHGGKLKKDEVGDRLELVLERTEDVLAALSAQRRPGQLLVGFAAEHGDRALEHGRDKLERKGLDALVVNDVSGAGVGFEAADNEVWILTAGGEHHVPKTDKRAVAGAILDAVLSLRSSSIVRVAP
jgi:phosphopantothenoylcysteine decarboxylase/phosphopantothenate--cysteine ligase